jgi:hypothetical protein
MPPVARTSGGVSLAGTRRVAPRLRALFGDKPCAAALGGEAECPTDEDQWSILESDQVPKMDEEPRAPGDEARARPRLCRGTSRVPASARQSQNVPVSYPRRIRISPLRATQHAYLHGFLPKPSDGLEPSTPSLPWDVPGDRSQPAATVFACLSRSCGRPICYRLPRVATAGLHKGSILCCLIRIQFSCRGLLAVGAGTVSA